MSDPDHRTSHGFDPEAFTRRMRGLYGMVFQRQATVIISQTVGQSVLDVGAASGFLSYRLRQAGFQPTAIDVARDSFEFAEQAYGVRIQQRDVAATGFRDKSFDTTILKEVVFHLHLEDQLEELARLTRRRLIIFQGTANPFLGLGRAALRHREHNRQRPAYYRRLLNEHRWKLISFSYHDPLAFYLSGGVIGPVLFPPIGALCRPLMGVDSALGRLVTSCGLGGLFCSRFMLVAAPPATRGTRQARPPS